MVSSIEELVNNSLDVNWVVEETCFSVRMVKINKNSSMNYDLQIAVVQINVCDSSTEVKVPEIVVSNMITEVVKVQVIVSDVLMEIWQNYWVREVLENQTYVLETIISCYVPVHMNFNG